PLPAPSPPSAPTAATLAPPEELSVGAPPLRFSEASPSGVDSLPHARTITRDAAATVFIMPGAQSTIRANEQRALSTRPHSLETFFNAEVVPSCASQCH